SPLFADNGKRPRGWPFGSAARRRDTIELDTALRYYCMALQSVRQSASAQRMGAPNNTTNAISLTQSSDSSARVSTASPRRFEITPTSMESYASYIIGRRTSAASEGSTTSAYRGPQ